MITEGMPNFALLFLSKQSKGTLNMLNLVKKYDIKYKVIEIDGN